MLTEPAFCRNSSINISIDNRYDNRFIHLGRPIFTVNHNSACVYKSDYTWVRACACYTREAPLTQSANWVSDHRYSTARFSYCSVNPLRLQLLYLLLVPPVCWYKLNCNRNDHERLFFSHHRPPTIRHFFPLGCCDCRWLRNHLSIPRAPEMSHKNIITIHFHIWTWYTPTIVISRACHGFSIKIYIVI